MRSCRSSFETVDVVEAFAFGYGSSSSSNARPSASLAGIGSFRAWKYCANAVYVSLRARHGFFPGATLLLRIWRWTAARSSSSKQWSAVAVASATVVDALEMAVTPAVLPTLSTTNSSFSRACMYSTSMHWSPCSSQPAARELAQRSTEHTASQSLYRGTYLAHGLVQKQFLGVADAFEQHRVPVDRRDSGFSTRSGGLLWLLRLVACCSLSRIGVASPSGEELITLE